MRPINEIVGELLEHPGVACCVCVCAYRRSDEVAIASIGRRHEIRGLIAEVDMDFQIRSARALAARDRAEAEGSE